MIQFAETNPSPTHGVHCNAFSAPFGLINTDGPNDIFNFSPLFAPKSNVLLSSYNIILEQSPPIVNSYFPYPNNAYDSIEKISSAFEDAPEFPEFQFVATNEFLDLDLINEDNSETSDAYTSPAYCNSDHSYNSPLPYLSQSVSPHASSAPIPINNINNQSISPSHADGMNGEDFELSNIIEHAASVSTCASGDQHPFTSTNIGGKNEQEIFEEIYRECEPKYWNVDSESDVRSSDSVISIDIGTDLVDNDAYDAGSETGCNRSAGNRLCNPSSGRIGGFSSTDSDPDAGFGSGCTHDRKKNQNRKAAFRYRSKKRSERSVLHAERNRLEVENGRLKTLVQDRQTEIDYLRKFMGEIRQKITGDVGAKLDF